MSATADEHSLDYREQVARIRRAQEESDKFAAEQHKLIRESIKLFHEGRKLERDRLLAPLVLLASLLGGAIVAFLTYFLQR